MTLTLDRVIRQNGISSCITQRPLPTRQMSFKSKKNFLWTDVRTDIETDSEKTPAVPNYTLSAEGDTVYKCPYLTASGLAPATSTLLLCYCFEISLWLVNSYRIWWPRHTESQVRLPINLSQSIATCVHVCMYRVDQKKVSHKFLSISLPNIDRFSKFFHCCILWKICSKVVTKHTTTP